MPPDHRIRTGDLFSSGAQTVTNAVNCHGVMGAGIARTFKARYPDMFADYAARCRRGDVQLGKPYLWKGARVQGGTNVLNFPTKDHWRDSAEMGSITAGLQHLVANYQQWGITSLALPALGCGLGGLDWDDVRAVMVAHLAKLDIPVCIYRPR